MKREYITLKDFLLKENSEFVPMYIKGKCKNPDCGKPWGISVELFDGVPSVPVEAQYCRECALREKAETNK